eukprot:920599-Lingulodinium_polyedra.AAC.1
MQRVRRGSGWSPLASATDGSGGLVPCSVTAEPSRVLLLTALEQKSYVALEGPVLRDQADGG